MSAWFDVHLTYRFIVTVLSNGVKLCVKRQFFLSVRDRRQDQEILYLSCVVVYQMDGIIQYAYCIVIQMYF